MSTSQLIGTFPQTQLIWVSGSPEGRDYGTPGMFEIDVNTGIWWRKTTNQLLNTGWEQVSSSASTLIEWVMGNDFQVVTMAYDPVYLTETVGTILWPDSSVGVYTTLVLNTTFATVDSFSVTHPLNGKTIIQPAVTRDENGQITYTPPLIELP